MEYYTIAVTSFAQNCSLLHCRESGRGAFVDPGGEPQRLLSLAMEHEVGIDAVLLTHGHLDHVGAARDLADRLGVPIIGPQQEDAFWFEALDQQAQMFGFPPLTPFQPDRWLTDGETIQIGQQSLEVIHTPGHTPGHVVFYHRPQQIAFVGDVLFRGSIGRSDFPRGDQATLLRSIHERLLPLGDEVRFVAGHGPESTFGRERRSNPFL